MPQAFLTLAFGQTLQSQRKTKIKTSLSTGPYFGAGEGTLTPGLVLGKDAL